MRLAGKLPSEIADALGVSNSTTVLRMLSERFALDAAYLNDQERSSILALELARLEKLQSAVWPAAMMGDPKSIDTAVKIIQARGKLVGLEQVDPVIQKNLVLVMGEKEEDYIASLQAADSD